MRWVFVAIVVNSWTSNLEKDCKLRWGLKWKPKFLLRQPVEQGMNSPAKDCVFPKSLLNNSGKESAFLKIRMTRNLSFSKSFSILLTSPPIDHSELVCGWLSAREIREFNTCSFRFHKESPEFQEKYIYTLDGKKSVFQNTEKIKILTFVKKPPISVCSKSSVSNTISVSFFNASVISLDGAILIQLL